MIELNPKNVAKSRRIFGNNANIVCANALKTKWLDKFKKIQGFDIIMGNPPYNSGNTGRSGKSGVDNKFIDTFLDFLNKNGFLVFVTKTGWRSRFGGGSSAEDLTSIHKKLENMTLKYTNNRQRQIQVMENNRWITKDKDKVMKEIYNLLY